MVCALLLALSVSAGTGSIDVQLVDKDGTPSRNGGVVLFVTDGGGVPILQRGERTDDRPAFLLPSFGLLDIKRHRSEVTDAEGRATFDELPPGKYRVIAQKWFGVDGHPRHPKGHMSANRWRMIPNHVVAYGAANAIVDSNQTAKLSIAPLGDGQLNIDIKREHRGNMLTVSLGKPLVMPELAGSGINLHLAKELVLVQHVAQTDGDIILRGLPTDRDVTIALLAYDNNGGISGIIARPGDGVTRRKIEVYAGWSDSKPFPEPPGLERLLNHLTERKEPIDWVELLDLGSREDLFVDGTERINDRAVYAEVFDHSRETVTLDGYGEVGVAELWTAAMTIQQRARREVRRRKQEQLRQQQVDSAVETRPDDIPPDRE
jgi:hypothetical protein